MIHDQKKAEEVVEEIEKLMGGIAAVMWDQKTLPALLEVLEEGAEWVAKIRKIIRAAEGSEAEGKNET